MMINVIFKNKQNKTMKYYVNLEAPTELNLLSSGGIVGFDWNKV